jgi:hypothetical protein
MTTLRTFRSFVTIGMIVAFNLLMIALAAMAGGSIPAASGYAPGLLREPLLSIWRLDPPRGFLVAALH